MLPTRCRGVETLLNECLTLTALSNTATVSLMAAAHLLLFQGVTKKILPMLANLTNLNFEITTGMEAAFNGRRWTGQNPRSLADGGRQQ